MNSQTNELYERLLVIRCQTGDEQAYHELVERFSPRLEYFLRKLVPYGDKAAELLQDVWVDVFRQLPHLQAAAAFRTWVYKIARGKATLQLRCDARSLPYAESVDVADVPEQEPDFSAADAAIVHSALDDLPKEQREVLVLRFLEELNYDEIAQVVGIPVGTVRSRIHYAKHALKRLMSIAQERPIDESAEAAPSGTKEQ